jgi:hypothetical protein
MSQVAHKLAVNLASLLARTGQIELALSRFSPKPLQLILQSLKAVQQHLEVLHRGSSEGAGQTAGELGNEQIVGSMSLLQMRAEK